MQMVFAVIMVMQRTLGNFEQTMPPEIKARNCTAPPGICMYCDWSVSKSKDLMTMEANCPSGQLLISRSLAFDRLTEVKAAFGICAPTAMTNNIHVLGS